MIRRFLNFVEILTKIASLLPFLLGVVSVLWHFGTLHLADTLLFFAAMTLFDMTTTALNNTIDARAGGTPWHFSPRTSRNLVLIMLLIATALGIWLAARTNLVVLAAGAACFAIGIFYTFGPAPISRMPLGEIFSGIFMGFFIPLIVVAINAPRAEFVDYHWQAPLINLSAHLPNLLRVVLLTIPPTLAIAGIMLANNICDVEKDVQIKRFTLPYYIGQKHALRLFAALYVAAVLAVTLIALTNTLPIWTLLGLSAVPLLYRNIRAFLRRPVKPDTFKLSVANLMLLLVPQILITGAVLIIRG